jgi:ABC-2 type transport system permease protein
MNLVAAERIKLFSTRSFWWCAALTVVLVVGLVGLVGALIREDGVQVDGTEFLTVGTLVVLVMAALAVTTEYRHGTMRTTFQAVPNRTAALLAKVVVVALAAGGLGLIAGFGGRGVAWLLQPDPGLADVTSVQWRAVAGSAPVFALTAVLAVAVAILLRSTAGSLSLLLGWTLVVEPVVEVVPHVGDDIRRWLPFVNADYFLYAGQPEPGRSIFAARMLFGPWGSLAYFGVITAALLVVALVVANRRDA